jgi:NSS family neurotransmitter:Na+ symporter
MQQDRGQWKSTAGFILAAAGSAIGLGNIWRFPYSVGQNGGAAFVFLYLVCVALICLPYLFCELAMGRHTKKNPVGAILAIKGKTPWAVVGALGVLTGVCILSYYGVIAGFAFGYIFKSFLAPSMAFGDFSSSPMLAVGLLAVFIALTVMVVARGVEHGIERSAKVLMPILLVLMMVVILRGITLEGAMKGVEYLLKPDFSAVTPSVVLSALGQAFFSLSLGMGAMITYGSYLPKTTNLRTSGTWVALFDTGIALLAGFMIFPALFALGKDPAAGPPLIFEVLPAVFEEMPLGGLVAVIFFMLLSIAALTSTVSLLEVPVSYLVDEKRWSRKKSVWAVGVFAFSVGLPSALSQGASTALGSVSFMGATGFLNVMDLIWGNISLAVGAMLLCIFTGWVWGFRNAGAELREGSDMSERGLSIWGVFVRFICPIFILLVLLSTFPFGARLLAALGLG